MNFERDFKRVNMLSMDDKIMQYRWLVGHIAKVDGKFPMVQLGHNIEAYYEFYCQSLEISCQLPDHTQN